MADEPTQADAEEAPKKKSKKPLLIGLVLALVLGGGGFYAVFSGMILGHAEESESISADTAELQALPDIAFVPIQPLVINLGGEGAARHLRFQAQLEVNKVAEADVTALLPRGVDVLNGYLRAVNMTDIESAAALVKLRAQMLRRVQVVTGEGRVRDLLIMEFVLN
jgi:flagellar FliL protein